MPDPVTIHVDTAPLRAHLDRFESAATALGEAWLAIPAEVRAGHTVTVTLGGAPDHRVTHPTKYGTVTYDDSPEMQRRVFDHVIAWFHSHGRYSGEGIMQSDPPQETAAPMLGELADLIGFETRDADDDA
jgi:protoporphyrinogen oxidase